MTLMQVIGTVLLVLDEESLIAATGAGDPVVEDVCRHIGQHLAEPLTNDRLARVACLSPSRFRERFRQAMGQSVQQYVQDRRVMAACMMLEHGETSVEEIAAACGFRDRFYLSRVFAQHLGMGPATYRQLRLQP